MNNFSFVTIYNLSLYRTWNRWKFSFKKQSRNWMFIKIYQQILHWLNWNYKPLKTRS